MEITEFSIGNDEIKDMFALGRVVQRRDPRWSWRWRSWRQRRSSHEPWLQSGVVVRDEPRQGFTGGSSEQEINLIPVSLEQLEGSGGRNNGYDINHIDLLNER
ncbi:hypothetical protein G4B88_016237 [Cannabis sativa]|uniref:Uncharacterized protein n=1 Tax=Cannabis sativa TaxID=3483 RepID=A0A7J6FN81_CANSA|nr:hypothetical protein G4B88_016237 [Cannabis sativa]